MLGNAATIILRMISSSLFKLDPFIESKGILRVGGRLSRSKLTSNEAHPIVLPKTALFTCFASRAVHIELTCTMETDSFIQDLCRFMASETT